MATIIKPRMVLAVISKVETSPTVAIATFPAIRALFRTGRKPLETEETKHDRNERIDVGTGILP
jgi:hypothetical protein